MFAGGGRAVPVRPVSAVRAGWLAWLVCGALVHAQGAPRTLGAQDCEKCHKPALGKWKLDEPAQFGPKAHANTHKQLSDPKAARFAAALGQSDPLAVQGRCVACHATVVRGIIRGGVSCESCHGPAGLWSPVHDKEPLAESYRKSIPLGLRDLHAKPSAIAAVCVGCHVTPEKALAAAGHPSGADFDAGASLKKLVHWTAAFTGDGSEHARYDEAQVTAAARPLVQKALAGGGAAARAVAAKPSPAGESGLPAAARGPSATPAARRAPAAPAPWDWDQPVLALPDDYPSDAAAPAAAGAAPPAPARPVARVARPALSIVIDQPLVVPPEVAAPAAPTSATSAPSATGAAAALRGQAAALLARLLTQGRRAPDLPPAHKPQEFSGPDSELLNVQDIALYLALETLRHGPPAAGEPPPKERP